MMSLCHFEHYRAQWVLMEVQAPKAQWYELDHL